mmetsp:Transcript_4591/g.4110  ORF Transcript_4591/g.4110 Transcript_4591/m.4110 type:complete len:407 (-) Transcript_4591:35-1255(-)
MKASVGIIYSDSLVSSFESRNLAFYLTGLLISKGHCLVKLVGYQNDLTNSQLPSNQRILFKSTPYSKTEEAPYSDITFGYWSSLQECHLLIIVVNSDDTQKCCQRVKDILQSSKNIPIFSLQRGVRNSAIVKDELNGRNGSQVVEGVVGFAVIQQEKTNILIPSLLFPTILFERLAKEQIDLCEGPLNLLESMDLEIYYRKNITPYAWGIVLYEHIHVVSYIYNLTLRKSILNSHTRLVISIMTRECTQVLSKAARGNGWKPDLYLITTVLTFWMWEMSLLLPDVISVILYFILRLLPPDIISYIQFDLNNGRNSNIEFTLGDIIKTGKRLNIDMPICEKVYNLIIENQNKSSSVKYHSNNMASEVEKAIASIGRPVVVKEFYYWLLRALAVSSIIPILLFLYYLS